MIVFGVPPPCEFHRALSDLSYQCCRCLLDISPQFLGLGGRTRAAAAAIEASAASTVSASYSAPSRRLDLAWLPQVEPPPSILPP